MMLIKRHVPLLILLFAISIFTNVALAERIEDKVQSPKHNFPIAEQLSASTLEQKRDNYLNGNGRNWTLGQNRKPNGDTFYLGWGQSDIKVGTTDIAFIDARVIAFESALLAAKGEFARFSQSSIASESIQRVFQDDSDNKPDASPNNPFGQLADKIAKLSNTKLDQLLSDNGVDASEFNIKKKRKLAEDSFRKSVTLRSIANVSGVRPLVTFEDHNSVGVIIVYSHKLRDQAIAITRGRVVAKTEEIPGRKTISEQLSSKLNEDKDYIFQHGIRIMKDNKGNAALVSFSQSGVKVTANSSKFQISHAIKAARISAKTLGEGQLAEFVHATVTLQDKTTLEGSAEINEIVENGDISIEETSSIAKLIDQHIKQTARAKFSGISTLRSWTANHPDTGHLVVGVVSVWTPYLSDVARSMKRTTSAKNNSTKSTIDNKLRNSADFESDASF